MMQAAAFGTRCSAEVMWQNAKKTALQQSIQDIIVDR